LLESSTASSPHRVRILFYGQSITQSSWSRKVETDLRARFPLADLQIENRSLGGFDSQFLSKAAESDLYTSDADLVIFHVYGAHNRYQDIVRRLRERTTAEVMLQTDHVTKPADLDEPTDPSKLAPKSEVWSAFMNQAFLPGLVVPYQTALCDQRGAWKRHLRARGLAPSALLADEVHLNGQGDILMASLVEDCLRRASALDPSPAEGWVRTLQVGSDVAWSERELRVDFEGSRIEAVLQAGPSRAIAVRIDGLPPSTQPSLYGFARAHARESGKWPPIYDLSVELPRDGQRLLETFTLDVQREAQKQGDALYTFEVVGSRSGQEGSGRSDRRFVSNSGRLVIDPEDWVADYAFVLAGAAPPPARFDIEVRIEPHYSDFIGVADGGDEQLLAHAPDGARRHEHVVTLASGLANTRHELVLTRDAVDGDTQLVALRIYRPPLARH